MSKITTILYWRDRVKKLSDLRDLLEIKLDKQIAGAYAKAAKNLRDTIYKVFGDIAANTNNPAAFVTANDLHRYGRYYDILNEINAQLKALGEEEVKLQGAYYEWAYQEIANDLGEDFQLTKIDYDAVKRAVNDLWCPDGKLWSERIWANQQQLAETLEEGIMQCLSTGTNSKQLAKIISDRFSVGLSSSQRLVRTEMSHIQNQAATDRYKEAGVDSYRIISFNDSKTCDSCRKFNNKTYMMIEMKEGVNCPPFHPSDRCTIIPIIKE